ncbi:hypothetical protein Acr_00g0096010 [Actinidia rufa]|uniref:Uncharacterized protein n=1 Tax=Actinidia rufa TaxID=165716 RepID=A0A7J0DZM8_9ERIC|nr:hypothetical protein Acr_00g0096010 [Actinidia rufa]
MEGSPEESPLVAIHPSVEEKTNIMTLDELNALRDTYSFPFRVQIRLPDEGETITSTRPGEQETRKFCSEDTPVTLRGRRASSFLSPATNGRFLQERLGRVPQEFRGRGEFQISTAIIHLDFTATNRKFLKKFFDRSRSQFSVPVLLDSKSFGRVFGSPSSRASRTTGNNIPSREVPSSSSDVGGKVLDPILDRFSNAPSSNSLSESCSDSSLPVELESDDWREAWEGGGCELGVLVPAKGVIIGEKRPERASPARPAKRERFDDGSKGKGVVISPEGKKKATSARLAKPRPLQPLLLLVLGKVLRPILALSWAPRLLCWVARRWLRSCYGGVILPVDKKKVEKLTLDQTATKLFHVIGQALVLSSSLAVRSREVGEQASLKEERAASMETKIARLQKVAADLEQQLAESRAREHQANDNLAKAKSDRDSLSDKFGRSGVLVNELREALNKSKEFAVEEFKSSLEFMVAVEDSASKYFGEGFNFCKVQLRRHHSDLAIDLDGTVVDQDLLAEQDEADKENDKEKTGKNEGGN